MVSKVYAEGTQHTNKQGRVCTVVGREGNKYRWRFDDGVEVIKSRGLIPCHPEDLVGAPYKVGDRVKSNSFGWAEVAEYNGNKDVKVLFDCGGETRASAYSIKKGHFAPTGALKNNTQELWLMKAKELHKTTYDYSNSVFISHKDKIEIHCNKCGENFCVVATDHINKNRCGCPSCARKKAREVATTSVEEFIERAGKSHNWKYTYILSSYSKLGGAVTVVCPIHGEYICDATRHSKGQASCPKCREEEETKHRFNSLKTRDDYTYLFATGREVWVLHKGCGSTFKVTAQTINSVTKHICPCCDKNRQSVTFKDFKHRAYQVFGDSYEYSNYNGINNKLTFTHKVCGNTYEAHAGSHISANYGKGVGCPYCATYGFSPGREAYLYILKSSHGYVKVGITHQEVEGRIRQISKSTKKLGWVFSEAKSWKMSGEDARRIEKLVHKHFDGIYTKPVEKFDGSGETYVGANIIEIEDFIKNNFQGE